MANKPPSNSSSSTNASNSTLVPNIKQFFYFGIAALALVALAGYLPKAAIMFTIILIAGVLLTHWKDYVGYLAIPK